MIRSTAICLLLTLFIGTAGAQDFKFTENNGQWNEQVHFRVEMSNAVVWGEMGALTYVLLGSGIPGKNHPDFTDGPFKAHIMKAKFIGGGGTFEGRKPHSDFNNYYIGNDSTHWAQGVKNYKQAFTKDLYPGIDMLMYGKGERLKYDLLVRPGADVEAIAIKYMGVENPEIVDGKLQIATSVGLMTEMKPFAYQLQDGEMHEVDCRFVIADGTVGFEVGDFNPTQTLVIDPEITFSTYIGSTASNFGFTATDDPDGNLVAGSCIFQAGYPTTLGAIEDDFNLVYNGSCDVGVSKFSADGSQLLYSTYLGGAGVEMAHSIVCDNQGNYVVMGTTGSLDFPVTAGAYQSNLAGGPLVNFSSFFINASHMDGCDFFISKFNNNESGLIASTYVGGSGTDGLNLANKLFYNYGDAFRGEVIVTEQNEIVVASSTTGGTFPMGGPSPQQNAIGGQDGIVFKMNASLSNLQWATYVGGGGDDAAFSVQPDSGGALVVTGGTRGQGFPAVGTPFDGTFNGDVDAFIVKYNNTGSTMTAMTYAGTSSYDQAYFVQLDDADNVYIIGQTEGNYPVSPGVYANPGSGQFIAKFNPSLSNQIWSTTIGTGSGDIDISPTAFLVSDCNQIYFSGWGGSTNTNYSQWATSSTTNGLPLTSNAFQTTTDGSDFYLCVLNPDAQSLLYATYFGGGTSTEHVDGGTSKFDKDGSVYQAVCAGCGGNDDFPYTPGAWSADNMSTNCNLGVFKFDLGGINAQVVIDGPTEVCEGQPAEFLNNSSGGDSYQWTFGDGEGSSAFEPTHIYESNGTFTITLIVDDSQNCLDADTASVVLTILPGVNPLVAPVNPICEGASTALDAEASPNFYWLDDPTLSATNVLNPTVTPLQPTTYYLVDENDCEADTVAVFVDFVVPQTTISDDPTICIGQSTTLEATGGVTYVWFPPLGLSTTNAATTIASPTESTTYEVAIITVEGCETSEEVTVNVDLDLPGGEIYPNVQMCIGHTAEVTAVSGLSWVWSPVQFVVSQGQTATVNPTATTTFFVDVTNACGTGTDQVTVEVIVPQAHAGEDGVICFGESHPVWAEGGVSYQWQPAIFVHNDEAQQTTVSPPDDQTFTVYVTDAFGCVASAQVFVDVLPLPYINAGPDRIINWLETDNLFGDASGLPFWWEPEIGISCVDCLVPEVFTEDPMWYVLHAVDANGCVGKDSVFVDVYFPLYVPNTFTPDNNGINDLFKAYGDNVKGFRMEIRNRWGELVYASEDIHQGWDGSVNGGDYYVQIDTYVWTVWYDTKEGKAKMVGHVNVIR
jgi:gliding motility-associated-like protein